MTPEDREWDLMEREWEIYEGSIEAAFTRLGHAWSELKKAVWEAITDPKGTDDADT